MRWIYGKRQQTKRSGKERKWGIGGYPAPRVHVREKDQRCRRNEKGLDGVLRVGMPL
ncbi:hypothetical protein BDV95DRAFT_189130 [Massariosphaeria phaeospora]|uniref:Uncharacterized protein n=1 Tax=Massariosphaeria phaeospora TaxID=100035 RepID=A0A7C8I0E1_9PLEO|nr:hypothetical protein BDV95DRAFT_189130 [Massariosphaeria phaeospora]